MILEIDSVELSFSNRTILNGIYLKAETGKVTGILGSNGCGKSCLLSIIFGSLQPKYKSLRLDGRIVTKPLYLETVVNLLPQHKLAPKNIKLKTLFKLLKVDFTEFTDFFESFAIYWNKNVKTLSGGEQRVLEIFLMLKMTKEIVLLDEPFSHIAPIYIENIKKLIEQEKQSKIIIITDHYYKDVCDISEELYLLKNGATHQIKNFVELENYGYLKSNPF
ncbi:ATP-binding cassette domain-containing protein [Subsaxibacter sp. CAU 1640]|uniref:ATP-binding cassette domain-containing protein n=1 Tax=Subsaxibacter sp. CAU 1640 TaxID=2933271 RepID=UPI002002AA05|nr:ATP-binding cassette domain-containing protein [Subsaxibacter sp. CAU 1640]MCK7591396.1 ATP-binding cassette domain-containing protein [Subsaxibacter sp. CAU 1640]